MHEQLPASILAEQVAAAQPYQESMLIGHLHTLHVMRYLLTQHMLLLSGCRCIPTATGPAAGLYV